MSSGLCQAENMDTEYRSHPPGEASGVWENQGGRTAEFFLAEAEPGGSEATGARLCFCADPGTPGSGILRFAKATTGASSALLDVLSYITISCATTKTLP